MSTRRRSTLVTIAATGAQAVYIPLANHPDSAIVDVADFERMQAAGIPMLWSYTKGKSGLRYVRCRLPGVDGGASVTVARLIVGAQPGQVVKYHNKNTLDLRRSNLKVTKGGQSRRDASQSMGSLKLAQSCHNVKPTQPHCFAKEAPTTHKLQPITNESNQEASA